MRTSTLVRSILFSAILGCVIATSVSAADAPASANIIVNGGFEKWGALPPNVAKRDTVLNIKLIPADSSPVNWEPMRELVKGQGPTSTIAEDDTVVHSGKHAVRIENRDMRDITYVRYSTEPFSVHPDDPHNIRPNRRYLVRWWVKGEDVNPAGTGPILMMNVTSVKDGKSHRTDSYEATDSLPKGTFDWQQRQFVFVTDPDAKWAAFTFQLRWTTGTVWYDDVELIDSGPVVHVETY